MNEIVKKAFPRRLKKLRTEKNINQAQLADYVKIGRASISNYEIGSRLPDAEVIVALADYFGVSTDYLLGRTNTHKETINSADEVIRILGEQASTLPCTPKEDLYRILSGIIELLNNDFEEEVEYSAFSVYSGIMNELLDFDNRVRKEMRRKRVVEDSISLQG